MSIVVVHRCRDGHGLALARLVHLWLLRNSLKCEAIRALIFTFLRKALSTVIRILGCDITELVTKHCHELDEVVKHRRGIFDYLILTFTVEVSVWTN